MIIIKWILTETNHPSTYFSTYAMAENAFNSRKQFLKTKYPTFKTVPTYIPELIKWVSFSSSKLDPSQKIDLLLFFDKGDNTTNGIN